MSSPSSFITYLLARLLACLLSYLPTVLFATKVMWSESVTQRQGIRTCRVPMAPRRNPSQIQLKRYKSGVQSPRGLSLRQSQRQGHASFQGTCRLPRIRRREGPSGWRLTAERPRKGQEENVAWHRSYRNFTVENIWCVVYTSSS